MISEKEFAAGFSGFWAECLPFLTPQAIAEFNLAGLALSDRNGRCMKPLRSKADKSGNDLVAEVAFALFAEAHRQGSPVGILADEKWDEILLAALTRIRDLRSRESRRRRDTGVAKDEVVELARRLETRLLVEPRAKPLLIQPRFKGCGLLDSCYGDVLSEDCLFELKTVDRNLRSADLRQLLVYCALNHESQQYIIDSIAVLNVRRGIEFCFRIDDLMAKIARKTSAEVFHEITEFLSSFETLHQRS
jgi:hypothetical protein